MIWNRSEIRRARQTPLKPVLERLGYRLNPIAKDNYVIIVSNEMKLGKTYRF